MIKNSFINICSDESIRSQGVLVLGQSNSLDDLASTLNG